MLQTWCAAGGVTADRRQRQNSDSIVARLTAVGRTLIRANIEHAAIHSDITRFSRVTVYCWHPWTSKCRGRSL